MRFNKYIVLLAAVLVLVGCGVKKRAVSGQPSEANAPTWRTCLIQGARATIITDEDQLSATITMQAVRDSMLVISVMPMLGMEMMRIEASPLEIIAIDKMHGQYAVAGFAELNRQLTPTLNYDILQQIASAELPTGSEKARLQYIFNNETIDIIIDYVPRKVDVPVRVMHQRLDRYTQVDISKWL